MDLKASLRADRKARPKPHTFYPPQNNRFVIGLMKLGLKRSIRNKLRVTEIEISDADLDRLRRLKGERCLLTPSHSGGFEPHIIMYLSKLLQDEYNFVAAIELFEQSAFRRWVMPRLGAYSIIRGAVDRPSFSMTRQLLAAGKRWVVIFPEGETVWQNSTVIPFQQGVIQLAFKGYEDARKTDEAAHLYCIPIAIKYVYLKDMHPEIDDSLSRLEEKLLIVEQSPALSRYARLRRIAEKVLVANEKARHVTPDPESSLDDRIQGLKQQTISRLEQLLGVKPSGGQTLLDRIRALFIAVDRIVYAEPAGSDYEQHLASEQQETARNYYEDLWRLLQFVAIYDGYVKESMTFERFMDVLRLLEREVLGKLPMWGPRKALVQVGEPVDLKDHAASYTADKREVVRDITSRLESSVREILVAQEGNSQVIDGLTTSPESSSS